MARQQVRIVGVLAAQGHNKIIVCIKDRICTIKKLIDQLPSGSFPYHAGAHGMVTIQWQEGTSSVHPEEDIWP